MADAAEHVRRWRAFRVDAGGLDAGAAAPWAVVVRFYSAVHLSEAFLRLKNPRFHATTHEERRRALRASTELKPNFHAAYDLLKRTSEELRYEPSAAIGAGECAEATKALQLVESFLCSKLTAKGVPASP